MLAAVLVAVPAGTGCAREERREQRLELVVRSSAADAGRAAGVDLERVVRDAAADVFERLPADPRPIRVEVRADPGHPSLIPELGVGGAADARFVLLLVDRPLRAGTAARLRSTVAHELHHVVRLRSRPVTSWTLADALVLEGLADRFAAEVFPGGPPRPWTDALSEAEEEAVWRRARPLLARRYDHDAWFRGGGDLPRWAGYTLGYRMAGAYLQDGRSASGEYDVDPQAVVEAYARAAAG